MIELTTKVSVDVAGSDKRVRLETEAIVVGYAMSRLDNRYLRARQLSTWKQAFGEASQSMSVPPASFKNLRDEFDPLHGNSRKGWHKRALRLNRQRVLGELSEVSDAALSEFVDRVLKRDDTATAEAIDILVAPSRVVHNVAERLLTGRLAEEFFLTHCEQIMKIPSEDIIDLRQAARGFDFAVRDRPDEVIEIKGLKQTRGQILFTDREWTEAKIRRQHYLLVVIGNVKTKPTHLLVRDPSKELSATCRYQTSLAVTWHATVSTLL